GNVFVVPSVEESSNRPRTRPFEARAEGGKSSVSTLKTSAVRARRRGDDRPYLSTESLIPLAGGSVAPSDRSRALLLRVPLEALAVGASAIGPAASASATPGTTGGPTPSARPTVAGRPTEGERLRASPGTWIGSGKVRVAYQWYRCDTMGGRCTVLAGATRRTRSLGIHDVGHTIGLQVKATDSHGSATASPSLVAPGPGAPAVRSARTQPTVSGDDAPGGTVRVDPGRWRPRPTSFSYQWARCNAQTRGCTPIKGATSDQYAVTPTDVGHSLVAIVQAR